MSFVNKLNLKQYVQTQTSKKSSENNHRLSNYQLQSQSFQSSKSHKENKKIKLNTLPCQEIHHDKDQNQMFLFRSTWEDNSEHFKEEIKGCTSPTFATQILSNGNYSSLFPSSSTQPKQHCQQVSKKNRVQNSHFQSKNKKSLQKFIGDNVLPHQLSGNSKQKTQNQQKIQSQISNINNSEIEKYLYQINKLQSINNSLKRQNKKLDEKHQILKYNYEKLQDQLNHNQLNQKSSLKNETNLMTNEELIEKMKNQSFWKFYLKAQKIIMISMQQNNQPSLTPINFMKQLQALRQMTSQMKKQTKSLKKSLQQQNQLVEENKDKISIQQAQIQQFRLKCAAYEASIKKLRHQTTTIEKNGLKQGQLKQIEQKYLEKSKQVVVLSKQINLLRQQVQQQKILNNECQKQRVSTKKKCQQLNEEIISLNKQLSSLKTTYNLFQIQKQELFANKQELIQKEKLKQKIYQLQKDINSINLTKEQEFNKIRQQYEKKLKQECQTKNNKEIQVKESLLKELEQKIQHNFQYINQLQTKNSQLQRQNANNSETIQKSTKQITQLWQSKIKLEKQFQSSKQELNQIHKQKQLKLTELSNQLECLTSKVQSQSYSLLSQQKQIQQLKREINEKEQILKTKQQDSQRLKASIIENKQTKSKINSSLSDSDQCSSRIYCRDESKTKAELKDYILKIEQKHDEALELYQTIYNQKVELELQLQQSKQEIQNLGNRLNNRNSSQFSSPFALQNEQILELIDSLLTIKQQIIKKILIFCPSDYKELLVQYIYYGDMIKQKYLEIINTQRQSDPLDQDNQIVFEYPPSSKNESYLQLQQNKNNLYRQNQTKRFKFNSQNNNQTQQSCKNSRLYRNREPYQGNNSVYANQSSRQQNNLSAQQQINQLLTQFIKIGKIIDKQTKRTYLKSQQSQKKNVSRMSRQKQQQLRISKQKQQQIQRKNSILNQINLKIKSVKQNLAFDQNLYHLKLANNPNQNKFSDDQIYSMEFASRPIRQPLRLVEDQAHRNISRPLFTEIDSKTVNSNLRNIHQEFHPSQQSHHGQLLSKREKKIQIQSNCYDKKCQHQNKNNFNHGLLNKLNSLKLPDRIRT